LDIGSWRGTTGPSGVGGETADGLVHVAQRDVSDAAEHVPERSIRLVVIQLARLGHLFLGPALWLSPQESGVKKNLRTNIKCLERNMSQNLMKSQSMLHPAAFT